MTAVISVIAFAALFAAFGLLAPALGDGSCHGDGEGGCGSCGNAGVCELKEHSR